MSGLFYAERLAFFLNLYHVMVMHAYLVLGPPDSSFKWVSYFGTISYQCADDVFSLTELEHCIVRARTSAPTQFLAKFVLPKSRYPGLEMRSKERPSSSSSGSSSYSYSVGSILDYRINFALNCGSLSNPRSVPTYKAGTLNEQLDDSARRYLRDSVTVSRVPGKKGVLSVTLPRICSWYAADFGGGSSRSSRIVLLVKRHLDDRSRDLLSAALAVDGRRFRSGSLQVTFSSYDYRCRNLRPLREE